MRIYMDGVRNMSKYDKMIEVNRKASEEKVSRARAAIMAMLADQERISVPILMKKTGLSRGFFYKNPIVRKEMDHALEQQAGIIDPRRRVIDAAMDKRMELMQKQMEQLKRENMELKKENEKLQKALGKKNLNILKNL